MENEVKLARAIADELWSHVDKLRTKAIRWEAEYTRLVLLDLFAKHPGMTAASWRLVEGGELALGHAEVDDGAAGQDDAYAEHGDPDELVDGMNVPVAVVRFIGVATGQDVEDCAWTSCTVTITAEQLKELSWAM